MIRYINADVGEDGRIRVRIKDANHFVLTLWERDERDGDDWLICNCRDIGGHFIDPLSEEGIGYYSVIGAKIIKAMTEEPK